MSTIKDLIDLSIQLSDRIKDRKAAADFVQLQNLIFTFQKEYATVQSEKAAVDSEKQELNVKISDLISKHRDEIRQFNEKYSSEITNLKDSHKKETTKLLEEISTLKKKIADLKKDDGGFSSGVVISSHFDR
jgi:predicted  nucleic acid-binding Zn-ribbon protein